MTDEDKRKARDNNIKIAVTAVMSVLVCAVFILALIKFGMNFQEKLDAKANERNEEETISIISVDYDATTFKYTVPVDATSDDADSELPKNYLSSLVKSNYDKNYVLIDNQDLLDIVLDKLKGASSDNISYKVDDGFFNSGSIIMVTQESMDLADFTIRSIVRDENYGIQIDTIKKTNNETVGGLKRGRAIFVKIRNIQPESILINVEKE